MTIEEEQNYLTSLGVTKDILKLLNEDNRTNFVIAELPFLDLVGDSNLFAVSKGVTFANNNINLTLRKNVGSNEWWLYESGTVNGESIAYASRFTVGSFKHHSWNFTYIIVSPYTYKEDFTPSQERAWLANASLLIKY